VKCMIQHKPFQIKKPKYVGVSIHMSGYMLGYDVQFKSQLEHPYDLVNIIK
jgi:uncharacterized membrane protein YjfL (UPF0719 family)